MHALLLKCNDARGVTARRQRKFARYQSEIIACGDDIRDLRRFVQAQVVAFRKILKKYKKWTGSTTLSNRFRDNILGNYKSFTKRDFNHLQLQHRELVATIEAVRPGATGTESSELGSSMPPTHTTGSPPSTRSSARTPNTISRQDSEPEPQVVYWNEYDHGSDAGDDAYYIDCDPNDNDFFPGVTHIQKFIHSPVQTIRGIFKRPSEIADPERRPLLPDSPQSPIDYFGTRHSTATTDNEGTEDEDASSAEFPHSGYAAHYASLPSVEEQRVTRYREMVLHRSGIVAFLTSAILLLVAGVLVATGRHRLRLEVDAGVALSVVVSLFSGCMGLGAMLYRQDRLSIMYQTVVWTAFAGLCVLNGMLLVLIVGSRGL